MPGPRDEPRDGAVEQRLRLVTALARDITARHDLDDVLAGTLRALRTLLDFGGGSIQLLGDDGWIRLGAADPVPPDDVLGQRIPLGSSIGGRVILTERPVYLPDVPAEPAVTSPAGEPARSPLESRVSPGGVRSYYGVPLVADGRAIGLLQVDDPRPDAWDEADRLLVSLVAPIVAAAIQNARAHARVAVLTAARRRDKERREQIGAVLDRDVNAALAALVALSRDEPLVREQVDRVTVAVGRIRGALEIGDPAPSDAGRPLGTDLAGTGGGIDLRGSKTPT